MKTTSFLASMTALALGQTTSSPTQRFTQETNVIGVMGNGVAIGRNQEYTSGVDGTRLDVSCLGDLSTRTFEVLHMGHTAEAIKLKVTIDHEEGDEWAVGPEKTEEYISGVYFGSINAASALTNSDYVFPPPSSMNVAVYHQTGQLDIPDEFLADLTIIPIGSDLVEDTAKEYDIPLSHLVQGPELNVFAMKKIDRTPTDTLVTDVELGTCAESGVGSRKVSNCSQSIYVTIANPDVCNFAFLPSDTSYFVGPHSEAFDLVVPDSCLQMDVDAECKVEVKVNPDFMLEDGNDAYFAEAVLASANEKYYFDVYFTSLRATAEPTMGPTNEPTVAPTGTPTVTPCADYVFANGDKWIDSYSLKSGVDYDCEWYGQTSVGQSATSPCAKFGDKFINPPGSIYNANEACCACGGGAKGVDADNKIEVVCNDYTIDNDSPWHDSWMSADGVYQADCAWYAADADSLCGKYGSGFEFPAYSGWTANVACCACGGGARNGAAIPEVPTCQNYVVEVEGESVPWHDDYMGFAIYDCDWYVAKNMCEDDSNDKYSWPQKNAWSANEACCGCGGGVLGTDSQPELPPPETEYPGCTDYTLEDGKPWHDSADQLYKCAWYSHNSNCVKYGSSFANPQNLGWTAQTACCACGGGVKDGEEQPTIGACADLVGDGNEVWHDSYKGQTDYTCDWYGGTSTGRCAYYGDQYPSTQAGALEGKTANQACCACGGGNSTLI